MGGYPFGAQHVQEPRKDKKRQKSPSTFDTNDTKKSTKDLERTKNRGQESRMAGDSSDIPTRLLDLKGHAAHALTGSMKAHCIVRGQIERVHASVGHGKVPSSRNGCMAFGGAARGIDW